MYINRELASGAFFAVCASALYLYVAGFPTGGGDSAAISPGFYPRLLALILGVLAAAQMVKSLSWSGGEAASTEAPTQLWRDGQALLLFCVTLGLLVAYPFLIRLIGFAPAGFLFVGSLIYALSADMRRGCHLVLLIVVTFAITIVTYVVFRLFLRIPFPTGIVFR